MARRIEYTGEPVLTLAQVASQTRDDPEDMQPELVEQIIIPGVTAQAEERTGAAIREAIYQEDWPESYVSGSPLDIGQATEVQKIERVLADGSLEGLVQAWYLQQGQRESYLHFTGTRPAGVLRITYKAGANLDAYPGVRSWLLMHAGTAYSLRETMVVGTIVARIPESYTDSLLAEITLPPRF